MLQRLLTKESKTIGGAAIILASASFLSRLIGIVRDRIFAHIFGASPVLDAYYAAFRIPDFLYNLLIVGALSAGFIPVFIDIYKKNKDDAWRMTNSLLNIIVLSLGAISIILFLLAPWLIEKTVPGLDAETQRLTIMLTRVMLVSPILLGISSIMGGVLQAFNTFLIYSLTPIFYNIGIIIGALFFVPRMGPIGLGFGVVLGASMHCLIQIPSLIHNGFSYQGIIDLKNASLRKIGRLMVPRTIGLAANQLSLLTITSFASTIGVGSIAVFNLSSNLQYFPIGIIGVSFAIAAFPTLSALSASKDTEGFIDTIAAAVRQVLFFILPLTVIFLLLRAQIVRVILGTGAFDWHDTIRTADTLAFFSLSLFAQCLIPLLVRSFYAIQDTKTPTIAGICDFVITVTVCYFLKEKFGVAGLALGYSFGAIVQVATLWVLLRHRLKTLHEFDILRFLYKISLAAAIMAITIQTLKTPIALSVDMDTFLGVFIQGSATGILGIAMYWLVCSVLRVPEILLLEQSLKKKLRLDNLFQNHTDNR